LDGEESFNCMPRLFSPFRQYQFNNNDCISYF